MPGIDEESVKVLKDAKTGKHVFFALVIKDSTVGALIAAKSKVSPTHIATAKKQCSASTVIQGKCHGDNGTMIFQTVKEAPASAVTLTTKLLKSANVSTHCDFQVNSDAENDLPPEPPSVSPPPQSSGSRTTPQSGSVPTPTGKVPPPQTVPQVRVSSGDREVPSPERLQSRLLAVGHWMKDNKPGRPDIVARMEKAFLDSGTAFKNHDYTTCEPLLGKLEEVIRKVGVQGTPKPEAPPPPPQPTDAPEESPPPLTRPRGGSLPPTPPPRQRSVSSPGSIPDSPSAKARSKLDTAKEQLAAFKNNPNAGWETPEAREKIMALKSAMLTLVSDEMAAEDDVKRKGLVFDSIDANYKKDVTAVVKRTMEAVLPAVGDPTRDTATAIQTLEEGIAALATAQAHYADVNGITDPKHLEQRQKKVAAIEAHQQEMRKIAAKLREVIKMKMQPVVDLLDAANELNATDPGAGGPELKAFGKMLMDDEATRKAMFQAVGTDQADGMLAMLDAQDSTTMDKLTGELAKTRAADSEFMDPLCKKAVQNEASKATDKGTFFRSNSMATKLTATYVTNSPNGKAYSANVSSKFMDRTKGKGPLEVDKVKDTNLSDRDIEKNVTAQKKLLGPFIDDITSDPNSIPPEMAKIAAIFYDEAKCVSGGDEEFATTQAGGFIMLRVVNPTITRISAERTNAQKKDSDRTKAANDQRLTILQSKILQNMSNGTTGGNQKEAFMQPFEDQVFANGGGFAPPTVKLRSFLKGVADRAPRT